MTNASKEGHELSCETCGRTDRHPHWHGANAIPAQNGGRVFWRDEDLERTEWCIGCGKHISRHYGATEYRCDPLPEVAEPKPETTGERIVAAAVYYLGVVYSVPRPGRHGHVVHGMSARGLQGEFARASRAS